MKNETIGANSPESHEVAWAILRLALGLIQITGATTSLLLLIGMGLNRLSISAVVVNGLFTLLAWDGLLPKVILPMISSLVASLI